MVELNTFGFIGGGNMAEAIIKGMLQGGVAAPEHIAVYDVDDEKLFSLKEKYGLKTAADAVGLVKTSDVVVLAVKPQYMDDVLDTASSAIDPGRLVISVAAGVPINHIQKALGSDVPIIRVMPNTPALSLAGAAAISPGGTATDVHLRKTREIFDAIGITVVLDEKYLDVVTGLSGSGPAYVFVFIEALTEAAVRLGLPRKEALMLAKQTVFGAAKLALESDLHTAELRDMVTSPGGTTAAGLHALEKGRFRHTVSEAVGSAAQRAKELAG